MVAGENERKGTISYTVCRSFVYFEDSLVLTDAAGEEFCLTNQLGSEQVRQEN
jgi:hypothetical protein